MIFKGNPDKVPCSDFTLDEQLETNTGQICFAVHCKKN